MELKKIWFPLVMAAVWVAVSAMTLSGFASFSGAAQAQRAEAQAQAALQLQADAAAQDG